MPVTKTGQYFGNQQQARMRDAAAAEMPKPAPIRQDADKDDEGTEQEITITKTPNGFHTSEPSGEENDFTTFDEAIQKAKECLGVEDDSGGDEQQGTTAEDGEMGGGGGY
jgi:hypothetical protein